MISTALNSVVSDEEKNMEYIDVSPRSVSILAGRKMTETEIKQKTAQAQTKNVTPVSEKTECAAGVKNIKNKRSQKR